MCSMSVPVSWVNIAPDMWMLVPLPLEAYVHLPGSFFASVITSCTVRAGTEGCTTRTLLSDTSAATGTRSLFGSKGILAYRAGLIRSEEHTSEFQSPCNCERRLLLVIKE